MLSKKQEYVTSAVIKLIPEHFLKSGVEEVAFAETLNSAGHFIGSKGADAEVLTHSLKKVPRDLLSLHGKKPKTCKQYWSEGTFISSHPSAELQRFRKRSMGRTHFRAET